MQLCIASPLFDDALLCLLVLRQFNNLQANQGHLSRPCCQVHPERPENSNNLKHKFRGK
jgi:hypothetical protein